MTRPRQRQKEKAELERVRNQSRSRLPPPLARFAHGSPSRRLCNISTLISDPTCTSIPILVSISRACLACCALQYSGEYTLLPSVWGHE
jgi:hypothetical protein